MMRNRHLILLAFALGWPGLSASADLDPDRLQQSLATLRQVGPKGQGHADAVPAWEQLSQASASQLVEILAGMNEQTPLADNWICAAVDTIADRTLLQGATLPVAELTDYLEDRNHSARSRRLAYEWILRVQPDAKQRFLPTLLNDASLELRRDAVAAKVSAAEQAIASGAREKGLDLYRVAWHAARDQDQIEFLAKTLRDLGETVDLPRHFGFIQSWQVIGPFDNAESTGFERVYPPEQQIDLSRTPDGKKGPIAWKKYTTQDDYGMVDLNQVLGQHKAAVAYASHEFASEMERPIELRLGCVTANKIWLNGQLLAANEVYHSGTSMDQYVARGVLQSGRNVILLKICQNEQTESWAQVWEFQLASATI